MKPNRKLKKPHSSSSSPKFVLEEIIGLTVRDGNGLASNSSNCKFVYIAGCVVVLYDADSGTQSHLMVSNRTPKPLSCVAVSNDGTYIAAGELGYQPAVLVWGPATSTSVSELKCHQHGVACLAFSPDGKHLVSVGFPDDGYLCLWDWRSGILVKKLKACSSFSAVASVAFSSDTNFILTAGKRHLKIWTVGLPLKSRAKTEAISLTMNGKPSNLGHYKGCTFIAITSPFKTNCNLVDGKGGELVPFYALTDAGVLCLLRGGLTITHSVDLKVEKGFALSATRELIACACNNGVVKLYAIGTLEYAGDLQYNEDKQCNITTDKDCQSKVSQEGILHLPTSPDAIACQFSSPEKLVVVYRDHGLYIWNIDGKFKATKCCVLVSHSSCIWDIKNLSCENLHDPSLACVARGCNGGVSFATCSADGIIRLWDLALQSVSTENRSNSVLEQQQVITEPLGTSHLVSAGIFERESVVSSVITRGYRSMAVSSDGKHLAAGDSDGNLHIYNLYTSEYTCIQNAHDEEILSLNFSLPVKKGILPKEDLENYYFLASGGSDRKILLFDVNRNFDLIASVDDHSAAVTSVKLTGNGRKILSCSADRSLIFRNVAGSGTDYSISRSHHQKTSHGTLYDMAVDPMTEIAVTVGQDKKITTFNIASGQVIRSFKQDSDLGDPVKVTLDPSCSYVVCSYSNRSICMYDFMSGEMVAQAMGHGEVVNGIIFLPDGKHLVSVGSDGCIFVWKVPTHLMLKMLQRIKENSCPLSSSTIAEPVTVSQIKFYEGDDFRFQNTAVPRDGKFLRETPTFKFSVSRLPEWAKSKVTSPLVIPMDPVSCEEVEQQDNAPTPVHLALHTPSNQTTALRKRVSKGMSTSSSDCSNSKGSSTNQGTCRSFALDKRWLTIHTVCLDLLNSPEVCSMKEQMVSLSSNLSDGPALASTDIKSIYYPPYEKKKSSAKKRYSTPFIVRRDHFRGQKIVLDEKIDPDNSANLSMSEQADSLKGSTSHQGTKSTKSTEAQITEVKDQEGCNFEGNEKQKMVDACREALQNLDASAKTALEVFTRLGGVKMSTQDNSEGELYGEAAEMLPLIAKNVHEIAKMTAYFPTGDNVDIPGFEPLLGRFAESLSQRVIQMLKENCINL